MRGDKEESFRSCLENCVEETRIELGKERNGAVKKKKKKGEEWLERIHAPTNLLAPEKFLGRFVTGTF